MDPITLNSQHYPLDPSHYDDGDAPDALYVWTLEDFEDVLGPRRPSDVREEHDYL